MPNESQPQFRFRLVFHAPRHWLWCLLIGLALAAGAGFAAFHGIDPSYEATAWLRAKPAHEVDHRKFMATQVQLIRSPFAIGAAIARPEIAALGVLPDVDQIAWLQRHLQTKTSEHSDLILVSCSTSDAKASAQIANAVRDAYFAMMTAEISRENRHLAERLEVERDRRKLEIDDYRRRLLMVNKQRAVAPSDKSKADDAEGSIAYAALQSELSATEVAIAMKQVEVAAATAKRDQIPIADSTRLQLEVAKRERDALQARHQALRLQIDRRRSDFVNDTVALDALFLQEDIERKLGVYKRIVQRLEELRAEQEPTISVRTVADAQVPIFPNNTKTRWLIAIAAAGAGLLAPFLLTAGALGSMRLGGRMVGRRARIIVKCGKGTTTDEIAKALEEAAQNLRSQ